jgi:hypothetical protein
MRLPLLVSPGTWDLLERLRPHLDVALDVLDTSLASQLPSRGEALSGAVRALGAATAHEEVRERLRTAARTGHHQVFSHDDLKVGVFPLRQDRLVVGLLVAAGGDAAPRGDAGGGERATDRIDRRLERIGWSLRAAIEHDIATQQQLGNEQRLSLWLSTLLRFLAHLQACASEAGLFEAIVHAAAIWGDFDARVYRRDFDDRYVLAAALPSAARGGEPHAFPASLLDIEAGPTRINSIAELEHLGWQAAAGEVLVIPVPPLGRPHCLLTVAGHIDARFEQLFTVVAQTLGTGLERLAAARARALHERLAWRAGRGGSRIPALAGGLLADLASAVGADGGRLLLPDATDGRPRVLATAGAVSSAGPPDPAPSHRLFTASRLVIPLEIGLASAACLELVSAGGTFGADAARLAEASVVVLESWLAGALRGLAQQGAGSAYGFTGHAFEARIHDEIERARRFKLETGLLVIGTGQEARDLHTAALAPLIDAVRRQLRSSDLLGRLENGDLAAVLVHTDGRGAVTVTDRIRRELSRLALEVDLPDTMLGLAAYPGEGDSVEALVQAARDAGTRGGDRPAPPANRVARHDA